jgi:hypothetical protein
LMKDLLVERLWRSEFYRSVKSSMDGQERRDIFDPSQLLIEASHKEPKVKKGIAHLPTARAVDSKPLELPLDPLADVLVSPLLKTLEAKIDDARVRERRFRRIAWRRNDAVWRDE